MLTMPKLKADLALILSTDDEGYMSGVPSTGSSLGSYPRYILSATPALRRIRRGTTFKFDFSFVGPHLLCHTADNGRTIGLYYNALGRIPTQIGFHTS